MHRPGTVWAYTVFSVVAALLQLGDVGMYLTVGGAAYLPLLLDLITLILFLVLAYHFFMLKKQAQRWAHIAFGTATAAWLLEYFALKLVFPALNLFEGPSWLFLAFAAFFWWAFVDYVKNKRVNDEPLFT